MNKPSELQQARIRVAREVEGDSDNPWRVAEANAIYDGKRDDVYPELRALTTDTTGDQR
jgi:hypothetical protein